jgi:mannose-6-phosphate isomerase-like protein (cupin superfamily)
MTQREQATPDVRILRPSETGGGAYFGEEIAGNSVASLGLVTNVADSPGGWRVVLAETDAGATFPWQYHLLEGGESSIVEIAVILAGQGSIVVGKSARPGSVPEPAQSHSFKEGEVVLIPANLVYEVHNCGSEPLRACIFFCAGTRSYWADGRAA